MHHYEDIEAIYRRTPRSARARREQTTLPTKERDILKAIFDYLAARRILAWRVNTGAVPATYHGKSRFIRFGPRGQSDIQGVLAPSGRFLAIEVKSAKGRVSDQQAAFLERVTAAGGIAGVCRSVQDVEQLLREAGIE